MNIPLKKTANGTPYLTEPVVIPLSWPQTVAADLHTRRRLHQEFLAPLGFTDDYFEAAGVRPEREDQGQLLAKLAGQLCYMSFGPKRSKFADREKYFKNIMDQGHESVLEHANYTFLFFGISRSLTHELVRHRHLSFSQLSQRYVNGEMLRFVERPEFQADPVLHSWFEERIDASRQQYESLAAYMMKAQLEKMDEARQKLAAADFVQASEEHMLSPTQRRKAVNQAARAILPNETEAPIIVTGNIRAWRWVMKMRRSQAAEPEIRALAGLTAQHLSALAGGAFFPE